MITIQSKTGNWHKRRAKEYYGGSFTNIEILELHAKQQDLCTYCLVKLNKKFEIDHVIPIAKGGANTIFNLKLSCKSCNQSKGSKLIYKEWIPPKDRI